MRKTPRWVKWSLGGALALLSLAGCSSNEPVNPPTPEHADKNSGSPPPADFKPPASSAAPASKNTGRSGSPPPANFVPPSH